MTKTESSEAVSSTNQVLTGASLQSIAIISAALGITLAGSIIPAVGVLMVVAVRQIVAAILLPALSMPKFDNLSWKRIWPPLLLGSLLGLMNLTLYFAVDLIGVGLALTFEFLGPLALALFGTRSRVQIMAVILSAAGLYAVLTFKGESTIDYLGIASAVLSGGIWATYILLSRRIGKQWPKTQGLSVAAIIGGILFLPVLLFTLPTVELDLNLVLLMILVGVLASGIPFFFEHLSLKYITSAMFGLLTCLSPVVGVFFGIIFLNESINFIQILGIFAISIACGIAVYAASGYKLFAKKQKASDHN